MSNTANTYRDDLQEIIKHIWKQYDRVGGMRDEAFDQAPFSEARLALYRAATLLSEHDNILTDAQAKSEGPLKPFKF